MTPKLGEPKARKPRARRDEPVTIEVVISRGPRTTESLAAGRRVVEIIMAKILND